MTRRGSLLLVAAIVLASGYAPLVYGQVEPKTNFHVAVNSVFVLCPKLVRGLPTPDAAELTKLGLTAIKSPKPDQDRYEGLRDSDQVQVWLDVSERRCTVNYGGTGYASVAGVVRDLVAKNGLTRVTGGDTGGAQGDVFEGAVPGHPLRARFIIIENPASKTAAISYTEKAAS